METTYIGDLLTPNERRLLAVAVWTPVSKTYPRAHAKYLVRRNGWHFVGTPCYGVHVPWWVPAISDGEHEPVNMLDTDEWLPLDHLARLGAGK